MRSRRCARTNAGRGGVVAVACLIMLGMLTAQTSAGLACQDKRTGDEPTIELRSELVSLTVSVSLPDGKVLTTLKQENFQVHENNARQDIAYFSAVDAPVDMMLLVDDSGSMRQHLSTIRRAAEKFVERMRPQDRSGLIAFGRQVELLAELTNRRATMIEAVSRIPIGTGTAFYDCLYLVATDPLKAAGSRKAVIVLSDGVDSSSYYSFEQSSRALESHDVIGYFIEVDTEQEMIRGLKGGEFTLSADQLEKYRRAFRQEESPVRYRYPQLFTPEEMVEISRGLYRLARSELRQMAERTGGKVFPLKSFSELTSIYEQIGAELGTLYSIGYYPVNSNRDGTWRALRVDVDLTGAKAHSRSGYWAPKD